ncbi:MAG: hypothetical protein U5J98_01760 [Halobacteriales archaeon]|nr:hypothetical protein [Halobacteriales archaeon]
MATKSARTKLEGRVEFYREPDGSVTAVDSKTGRARGGDTRGEAVRDLGEVLILLAGGGEPIEDEDAALREVGIDPDEIPDDPEPLPDFMQ